MEMNHDVILLCTSILSISEVVKAIPFQSLKTQTLFVDVLSVKEYPREVLLQVKRKKKGNYPFTSVFLYLSFSHRQSNHFLFFFICGCSIKLQKAVPSDSDLLCTHPMFGPESGRNGWTGLGFMFDKVRIRNEDICSCFLNIFATEVKPLTSRLTLLLRV